MSKTYNAVILALLLTACGEKEFKPAVAPRPTPIQHNLPDPAIAQAAPNEFQFTIGMTIEDITDAFPKFHLVIWGENYECDIYATKDTENDWQAPTCHFQERDHCVFNFDLDGSLKDWHGNAGYPKACEKLLREKNGQNT